MRAVLQRVACAEVTVSGRSVGKIGRGLMALIGIGRDDTPADAAWLVNKLLAARLFEAGGKQWAGSVRSLGLEVLLVSQFTLHGNVSRKPKPDFHRAMGGEDARAAFDAFVAAMRVAHGAERVATGEFGAMMEVSLVNSGPVTLLIDSKNRDGEGAGDAGDASAGGTGSGGSGAAVGIPSAMDGGEDEDEGGAAPATPATSTTSTAPAPAGGEAAASSSSHA
jgi:D-tyrosyl-tRNA(Tyr) deacylase